MTRMGYCTETFTTRVDGNERLTCSCGEFVQRDPSMADGYWSHTRWLFERHHATFVLAGRLRWLRPKRGRNEVERLRLQQLWVNQHQAPQWRDIPVVDES